MSGPVISIESIHKSFGNQKALQGVSLELQAGERVALIGPSGAGKTTLLRMITGVIRPDSGALLVLKQRLDSITPKQLQNLRQQIGFLYQSHNLVPNLRVVHNVLMAKLGRWSLLRSLFSLVWPQDLVQAKEVLKLVELEDRLWALPENLSGGERQRVALARLFLQKPDIILADEPVSSLDLRRGQETISRLSQFAKDREASLLVSLHSLDLLQTHFDRVIALKDGELFWQGKASELNQEILHGLYGAEYQSLHLNESDWDESNWDESNRSQN